MGFLPRSRPQRIQLTLFADYHQLYVQDERATGDLSEAWTAQAVDDRIAVAPGVFGVGTEEADDTAVTIELLDREPADDTADWSHVTECSLEAPSGSLVVAGATDYYPDARRIKAPARRLRARVSHRSAATQTCRVQMWPGEPIEPRVLVRWQPPAKTPPPRRASTPPSTREKATAQARLGNTELALEALIGFSQRGDAAASASVAELLAFRGEWERLTSFAVDFLAHPNAVGAGNVFTDTCLLVRRAAQQLGTPGLIKRAVAAAPAARRDMARACLIDGRPLERSDTAGPDELAQYHEAAADAARSKRFAGKPDALARHVFALAEVYEAHDEMVAQWPSKAHLLDFDQAVATARVLARRNRLDDAWHLLEPMLRTWWPVDDAQVAPVVLLYDPELAPIMTPARCAQVLASPRGPEA